MSMDLQRKIGETDFEWELRLCLAKKNGELDADWSEIVEALGLNITPDQLRKQAVGYQKTWEYIQTKQMDVNQIDAIKKERIKLHAENIERAKMMRSDARRELFYENIGVCCQSLPTPEFQPITPSSQTMTYVLTLADIHYGAKFTSETNEYSPEIATQRMNLLSAKVKKFVLERHLDRLIIVGLGDDIQGILRMSDLKMNESPVVSSVVEVSRLIATLLNDLSQVCYVEYYHTSFSNHSQVRPLGTKASELSDEDMEYVIGNYIKDLCVNNSRISIVLGDSTFLRIDVPGNVVYSSHGNRIRNIETSIKDYSELAGTYIDYMILGHFHSGKIIPVGQGAGLKNDKEVIVCPAFCGADPYSDSLMKGSCPSCYLLGFDTVEGHTETYKLHL